MTLVAQVGPGIFVLAFLWIVAFLLFGFFFKSLRILSYLVIVVAATITLVLLLLPNSKDEDTVSYTSNGIGNNVEYDYLILVRILILVIVGLFTIIGLILMLMDWGLTKKTALVLK